MTIDYMSAGFWLNVGQWLFNGLIAAYLWVSRKQNATNKRVAGLDARLDAAEKKIIMVCSNLEHLPDYKQIVKLGDDITALRSELAEVRGRLSGVNRAVDLINEFLINQGVKK